MDRKDYDLWRSYYQRGDLVWIEGSDGRSFQGIVLGYHIAKDHNRKGKIRYQSYRVPSKLYYVFCLLAREIQPSAGGRSTVRVRESQIYPRSPGENSPKERWMKFNLARSMEAVRLAYGSAMNLL